MGGEVSRLRKVVQGVFYKIASMGERFDFGELGRFLLFGFGSLGAFWVRLRRGVTGKVARTRLSK